MRVKKNQKEIYKYSELDENENLSKCVGRC